MIISVIFYLFVAFAAIQIIYHLFFLSFLFNPKNTVQNSKQPPISLLIYAKNSAEFLRDTLPSFIEQQYPNFEIILLDNESSDDTSEIIDSFKEKNNTIKVIAVENNEAFWGNKKYVLTLGIKAAKHKHIVCAEAKYQPTSNLWLAEISKGFSERKTIVLGYNKIKKDATITNLLIRFDNLIKAVLNFTLAKQNGPFKAFTGNWAFDSAEFYRVKGFINHIKIKSGEYDLFIRDAANKKNTSFCFSENSFVETSQNTGLKEWFEEKRNAVNFEKQYQFIHRFLITLFTLSKALFLLLTVVLLLNYPSKIILAIVLFYYVIQFIVIGFSSKKLKEPVIIFFLPFLEVGLLLIQFSIFIVNLFSKPNR